MRPIMVSLILSDQNQNVQIHVDQSRNINRLILNCTKYCLVLKNEVFSKTSSFVKKLFQLTFCVKNLRL